VLAYFSRILDMFVKGFEVLCTLKFEVHGSHGHVCEPFIVFWDVTLCSLVDRYHLVEKCCFLHIG